MMKLLVLTPLHSLALKYVPMTYLKMAINMEIRRMLAMRRKMVIRIGGIQYPGTHELDG